MNKKFLDVVGTVDHLDVFRVTISPDGEFSVPNEKDGRVALLSRSTRAQLASFVRSFAGRLQCPNPKHVTHDDKRARKRRKG